ncbi:M48 family metalloprotease [Noviherbaspirillum aridicola]|uniref:Lipoprotein n=1 Tax=Noviherbaspirillum aridicola TaxID=2849687 RepID=A0ABQ4Q4S4_9BURK|nr:M48 family metalloprotease [Noviherbaspirillum aridicola]GIZ51790.1 lipoprotein [Noviherbaspirillum aridicola]
MRSELRQALAILLAVLPATAAAEAWGLFEAARDVVGAATLREQDILGAARRAVQQKDQAQQVAADASPHARRLQALTAAHAGEDGLSLNFKAYQSSSPAVFAAADGSIRLTSALMDQLDDDELRAVIGHQIGHVSLGHSMSALRTAYLGSAARNLAGGAAGTQGYAAGTAARELGDVLEQALRSQFSQAQEQAAGDYAAAFLNRHRYPVEAMERAERKLARQGGRHGTSPYHPDPVVSQGRRRLRPEGM